MSVCKYIDNIDISGNNIQYNNNNKAYIINYISTIVYRNRCNFA